MASCVHTRRICTGKSIKWPPSRRSAQIALKSTPCCMIWCSFSHLTWPEAGRTVRHDHTLHLNAQMLPQNLQSLRWSHQSLPFSSECSFRGHRRRRHPSTPCHRLSKIENLLHCITENWTSAATASYLLGPRWRGVITHTICVQNTHNDNTQQHTQLQCMFASIRIDLMKMLVVACGFAHTHTTKTECSHDVINNGAFSVLA